MAPFAPFAITLLFIFLELSTDVLIDSYGNSIVYEILIFLTTINLYNNKAS